MNTAPRITIYHLLFLVLVVRLCMFMVEQPWDTEVVNNTILKDDALGYHSYAVKLIESGGLKSVGDFSVRRTPGYPFYLSTIYTFAGISPWVVILSQIIVSAGIAYLIFSITKDWFNETIGKYVVVIFALEPHAILYSLVLVPDILYLFTTLLAIRFFLHSLEKEKYWIANLLLSGFFVAISVYLKPVAQFLPLAFIAIAATILRTNFKRIILVSILFLAAFSIVLAPWMIRNHSEYGYYGLTDKGGDHLIRWVAAYVYVAKEGVNINEARSILQEKANNNGYKETRNPFEKSKIQSQVSVEYIRNNFITYLRQHIKGISMTFLNLDTKRIAEVLGIEKTDLNFDFFASPGITESILSFFRSKSPPEIAIGVYVASYQLVLYLLALIGIFFMIKLKRYRTFILQLIIIGYYLALIGPIGLARYKISFMPFYLMLSGFAIYILKNRITGNSGLPD